VLSGTAVKKFEAWCFEYILGTKCDVEWYSRASKSVLEPSIIADELVGAVNGETKRAIDLTLRIDRVADYDLGVIKSGDF